MKKRPMITIAILSAAIICVAACAVHCSQYPIIKNDLEHTAAELISHQLSEEISQIAVYDSDFSNQHAAYIFYVNLADGTSKYYGVSFSQFLFSSHYRVTMMADYRDSSLGCTLLTNGIPYDVAYDISDYHFTETARVFNSSLRTGIFGAALWIVLLVLIRLTQYFHAQNAKKDQGTVLPS